MSGVSNVYWKRKLMFLKKLIMQVVHFRFILGLQSECIKYRSWRDKRVFCCFFPPHVSTASYWQFHCFWCFFDCRWLSGVASMYIFALYQTVWADVTMLAKSGVFLSKFRGMKGFETMSGKQRNNQKPYKYNWVFHIGGRLARSLSPKLQLWLMHQLKQQEATLSELWWSLFCSN